MSDSVSAQKQNATFSDLLRWFWRMFREGQLGREWGGANSEATSTPFLLDLGNWGQTLESKNIFMISIIEQSYSVILRLSLVGLATPFPMRPRRWLMTKLLGAYLALQCRRVRLCVCVLLRWRGGDIDVDTAWEWMAHRADSVPKLLKPSKGVEAGR